MTVRLFPEFETSPSQWSRYVPRSRRVLLAGSLCLLVSLCYSLTAQAGEVEVEHGTILRGDVVPILGLTETLSSRLEGDAEVKLPPRKLEGYPIIMVDDGVVRYFVSRRTLTRINNDQDLSLYETFKLPQRVTGRGQMLKVVGSYENVTDFDKYGRRTVTLKTNRGMLPLLQGVTEITPHYLKITGLKQQWDLGMRTTSVKEEILDAMLKNSIDPLDPNERIAVARFYIQAGLYLPAGVEFARIEENFPEYKEKLAGFVTELRTLQSQQLLNELEQRRKAGQHRLAQTALAKFPTDNVDQSILRQIREFENDYSKRRERIEKALFRLGELEAEVKDVKNRDLLQACRREVNSQLNYESIDRLGAFLNLENDDSLSAREKLALAYSGWIVGAANVVTNLDTALNLWTARAHVLEYLRNEDEQLDDNMIETLSKLEGVSTAVVKQMIPLLPPILDTPIRDPENAFPVQVTDPQAQVPVSYSVLLPLEYNPHHTYPMIVALRAAGSKAETELHWWGKYKNGPGQSQRRGYIVIAPEYLTEGKREYKDNTSAHYAVIQAIRDARKRFNVDSDRVFLAGHGTGADAAFDIGMSHPGMFAGVIPIAGNSSAFNLHYWQNDKDLAWYIVGGELDRDTLEHNSLLVNRMLRRGYDVIYAEYKGRGYEHYYEEIHRLFEWMELHQRLKYPKEIDAKILRPLDNRYFWVRTDGFPRHILQGPEYVGNGRIRARPVTLGVSIKLGNVIYVKSGGNSYSLWLNPELVDFDKRLEVHVNNKTKFNDFLRPDMKAMLDDVRNRGDRQKLFDARLDF
ncbi:hypothetical protein Pan153_31720 [Gimesia panareensis]|uniref:Alpha/beta hydrolase family protein n=1 Tax=Gimesia panareensis TaxID=2527978 RepID=A0A518FQ79_9PLAN|nr:hypothetical protein [Gimesia panareensis]QDV18514.1 hypothetical protein Pan153_31720 [Gimesia panareensis]